MSFFDHFTSKEPGALDTVEWILRVTVVTLAMIMVAVIATLMGGLFVETVDNKEVFSIIGPAFNTIVGAFVGLLGGLSLNNVGKTTPEGPLELDTPAPEPEPDPVVSHPVASSPVVSHEEPIVDDNDDDDDMAPWEKYRNDLRYDANGDGVVDEDDFPDWRNPAA
jgi:hypothetical protein